MSAITSATTVNSGTAFTLFLALPQELRLKIWREALLAEWSVWAVVVDDDRVSGGTQQQQLPFTMACIGPTAVPYVVRQSCREARQLHELTQARCLEPVHGHSGPAAPPPPRYWINLDTAVLWLGPSWTAVDALNSFQAANPRARPRHVALSWAGLSWILYDRLASTCRQLAGRCLSLRTIIVYLAAASVVVAAPTATPASVELAARLTAAAQYDGPDWQGWSELSTAHFEKLVREQLAGLPAKIHLLSAAVDVPAGQ